MEQSLSTAHQKAIWDRVDEMYTLECCADHAAFFDDKLRHKAIARVAAGLGLEHEEVQQHLLTIDKRMPFMNLLAGRTMRALYLKMLRRVDEGMDAVKKVKVRGKKEEQEQVDYEERRKACDLFQRGLLGSEALNLVAGLMEDQKEEDVERQRLEQKARDLLTTHIPDDSPVESNGLITHDQQRQQVVSRDVG